MGQTIVGCFIPHGIIRRVMDGVATEPWWKNKPEDLKTETQLLGFWVIWRLIRKGWLTNGQLPLIVGSDSMPVIHVLRGYAWRCWPSSHSNTSSNMTDFTNSPLSLIVGYSIVKYHTRYSRNLCHVRLVFILLMIYLGLGTVWQNSPMQHIRGLAVCPTPVGEFHVNCNS